MNPYALLVGLGVFCASIVGSFFYGLDMGRDRELAAQAREDQFAQRAVDAAASAAAAAISRIEVKQVTIRQQLEREVRENTVYRDCRSGDAALRLLNSSPGIAASGAVAAGGRELPASGAAR